MSYTKFQKNLKAVALEHDKNSKNPPKVTAIGRGVTAEMILEIARENNIPIHQDSDLTQILDLLEIGTYIPVEVYGTLAAILSYIYKQNALLDKKK